MLDELCPDCGLISERGRIMGRYGGHREDCRYTKPHAQGTCSECGELFYDCSLIAGGLCRSCKAKGQYWMTTGEAAELLGVTPAWVATLCRKGRLTDPKKMVGFWLVEKTNVENYRDRKGDDGQLCNLRSAAGQSRGMGGGSW